MQFMNSNPEKRVKKLSNNDFKYLIEEFGSRNLELLKQKDAYPYEYIDSFKRFSEEKLPNKKRFYTSVKDGTTGDTCKKLDGHISDEDYQTCLKIWNEFNRKNMGDYHDHYLKKQVSLFTCLKFYKLDPCYYFSSPGLSWDEMLKVTAVQLEKISDIDMNLFIEKGLRGGISYIAKRQAKANNKYMKSFDLAKTSVYISYLHMNNLHG